MFLLLLGVLVCFLRCNIFDGRGLFRLELRGGFTLDRFDVDLCGFLRLCGGVDFDGFDLDFRRLLRLNHDLGLDNDFRLDGGLGSAFCHVRSWGSSVASTGGISAAAAGAEGAGGASVWPFAVSASWTSPPTVASSITGGTGRSSARASSPRPSMIASATRRESRLIERIASSLPGMT